MRSRALAGAIAVILACSTGAGAVTLDPSPDAQGRQVVNAVFRDYLSQLVGVQVQSAVVDVEGNGVGEIVARFVHSGSCRAGMSQCRTVLLRYDNEKWGIVLDRPADGIDIGKPAGRWVFSEVSVDGQRWTWNGKAYAPTLEGVGQRIDFAKVPPATVAPIAVAFGQGAVKLAGDAASGVSFEYARPKVSKEGEHILVRMKGGAACGDVAGCPVRLLERDGESWRSIMDASAVGDVAISRTSREGRSDVVLGTSRGYVVMGWNGKSYGVADVAEATAAPRK